MIDNYNYFRFWCYKVLPLVYDDSLSYYEVLCKVVNYINGLIDEDKILHGDIEQLKKEVADIQAWIDAFDTEVAERIIREALTNLVSVMFTSLILDTEEPGATINTAISNGCRMIYVDSDITLLSPIMLTSGCSIIGVGGKIDASQADGIGIRAFGANPTLVTRTDSITSGDASFTVESASNLVVGDRYWVKGDENLFYREDQNSLGYGTSNASTVYGGYEFRIRTLTGTTVRPDRTAPHYVGVASMYKTNDVENVIIENITITGRDHLIELMRANNCTIRNCNLICSGNYPLYLGYTYECTIENNAITELANTSWTNNMIVLGSGGENIIRNNKLHGGYQGIDLSYITTYSYNNVVANNDVFGTYRDCFTTHPAAFNNIIVGNFFVGDVNIRAHQNTVTSNSIFGTVYIGQYFCQGTTITGNFISGLYPIELSYGGGLPSFHVDPIFITNNTFHRCNTLIDGRVDGSSLVLTIANNVLYAPSSADAYLIAVHQDPTGETPNDPVSIYKITIAGNVFDGYSNFYIFGDKNANTDNLVINNNSFRVTSAAFIKTDNGQTLAGTVNNNTVNFSDSIDTLVNPTFGANYPPAPLKGQTFLKNDGTFAVFDGTDWKVITTT